MNDEKINELRTWMKANETDLAYITDPDTVAYFTGFASDPHERILALFFALDKDPFLFAPALDAQAAKESPWEYDVIGYQDAQDPWKMIASEIHTRYGNPADIIIEKSSLSLDHFEAFAAYFPKTNFSKNLTPVIEQMQLRKTPEEIDTLIEAGSWADVAFEIGFSAIKEGATEAEIIAEIEYQLKRKGVAKMSFDTEVLAGAKAANPHGTPGDDLVQKNHFVLFDLGVIWKGYCSDATRTVAFKEPTKFQREIYDIVLEAQLAAQEAVKPGMTASGLDRIAREVIENYGYGEAFNHRLGHGIGTTIHEYPSLVAGNDLVLEEGMCFSIEPGIYLPGEVGVRIEDCVYVTKDGCQPFTKTSKELQIIE
ncbi:aminopeptidase P family protein [Tetragenococcus koreensis]|uniref:aminopeptidase P family protein n=1 Tax=Tetragenococcus koreensis TaxID=290335 RepID=UPI000F508046|nr:Xaa-Pro peptidase family protein [Tetragenococcus koreensis]AYW45354.1 aminopeptidase P family protein [Tetragenococcus koreensis]MDN6470555.1 Xaa-Pro peptidase family protein [Tetragenococcus koreensis]MDN6664920.1 Xaa-Pro peptidase family protein [Tetragenococcus koreensis]GEN91109.1 dipeptidase [Tetragenococcus koreensis]